MNKESYMSDTNTTGSEVLYDKRRESIGFAVAAFVISLVNMIIFGSMLSFICVPLALLFAIISLAQHRRGKALSIISIVISAISTIIFVRVVTIAVRVYPDIRYFLDNDRQIVEDYNETGEIPERFVKYEAPKYDLYWDSVGYESFEGFFDWFVSEYERTALSDDPSSGTTPEMTTSEGTTETERVTKKDDDTLVRLT